MDESQKNIAIDPGELIDFVEMNRLNCPSITRIAPGKIQLSAPGTYLVQVQMNLLHAGQLIASVNGEDNSDCVLGTACDGEFLHGFCIFNTDQANSIFSISNPSSNCRPIHICAYAGGVLPVGASLMIMRIRPLFFVKKAIHKHDFGTVFRHSGKMKKIEKNT